MVKHRLRSSRVQVARLLKLLEGQSRAVILLHDNPDPDAMAGGLCLAHLIESRLSVKPRIVYGGLIGRADNRYMARALNIPLWLVDSIKFRRDDAVILVDTQPGFANNSLPPGMLPRAVLDHHAGGDHPRVPLVDVRPAYGAVCSILTEYLASADVAVPADLATAVCYAIATETQVLGRDAAEADIAAFLHMFPLCDQPLLGRLRHPPRSLSFLIELDHALHAARQCDGVVVCHLGPLPAADSAAEMADVLAAVEGIEWVLCTGLHEDLLMLSVRTARRDAEAGELLRSVVGERSRAGGHGMMAGGALRVQDAAQAEELQENLTERFLHALGREGPARLRPLMDVPEARAMSPQDPGSRAAPEAEEAER